MYTVGPTGQNPELDAALEKMFLIGRNLDVHTSLDVDIDNLTAMQQRHFGRIDDAYFAYRRSHSREARVLKVFAPIRFISKPIAFLLGHREENAHTVSDTLGLLREVDIHIPRDAMMIRVHTASGASAFFPIHSGHQQSWEENRLYDFAHFLIFPKAYAISIGLSFTTGAYSEDGETYTANFSSPPLGEEPSLTVASRRWWAGHNLLIPYACRVRAVFDNREHMLSEYEVFDQAGRTVLGLQVSRT